MLTIVIHAGPGGPGRQDPPRLQPRPHATDELTGGSRLSFGKRADLLASEFQRFGMAKPAAATLSSDVVLRHPLAHRVGVPKLVRRLVRHGVDPENANHLALTLWGLERLMLGACFQDLIDVLRRAGVEDAHAFPACVDARRLWRDHAEQLQPVDPDVRFARWCVLMLASLVLTQLVVTLGG